MLGVVGRAGGWVWHRVIGATRKKAFESPMEERFFEEAKRQGIALTLQHPIGPYRADFVVEPVRYYKIAVEVDGRDYHSDEDAVCRDYERDWYFMEHGWVVFRVRGRQVNRQPRQVVERLRRVMSQRRAPRLVVGG